MQELKSTHAPQPVIVVDADISSASGHNISTLEHIKANLIQYLRRNPIIDFNNEVILKVVYSMMNFTKAEIERLELERADLPVYMIDQTKTKAKSSKKGSSSI
jgi:hypothetical protein